MQRQFPGGIVGRCERQIVIDDDQRAVFQTHEKIGIAAMFRQRPVAIRDPVVEDIEPA